MNRDDATKAPVKVVSVDALLATDAVFESWGFPHVRDESAM